MGSNHTEQHYCTAFCPRLQMDWIWVTISSELKSDRKLKLAGFKVFIIRAKSEGVNRARKPTSAGPR